jgi:hypothetical protein
VTLAEATAPRDMTAYAPAPAQPPIAGPYTPAFPPDIDPFLRCPLPPVQATPDSLRQFYRGGQIPQRRILPPTL